jgi:hypothetical protein
MKRLSGLEAQMLASPDQQISLTDPDARSMATSGRGSGVVGSNVQVAVETTHPLIVAHEVINDGCDRAQLSARGKGSIVTKPPSMSRNSGTLAALVGGYRTPATASVSPASSVLDRHAAGLVIDRLSRSTTLADLGRDKNYPKNRRGPYKKATLSLQPNLLSRS